MNKGIIFSVDAILGAGIVITLFSAIMVLSLSEPNAGTEQAILYTKATDRALAKFYVHGALDSVPTAPNVNCNDIYAYGDKGELKKDATGKIVPEARGCAS